MKVSKDGGQTFVDISEDPEQQNIARSKGYEPYVEVTNGEKRARIAANPQQMKIAQDKGYNLVETQANQDAARKPREEYNPWVSAAQGATSTVSFGLDDEMSGVGSAVKAGLSGKNPMPAYYAQRDTYRQEKEKAAQDNPVSHFAGALAGGALIPMGAAGTSGRLGSAMWNAGKAGMIQGAAQGFGDSEDIRKPGDVAANMGVGGVAGGIFGAGVGGAFHGIANPGQVKEAVTETIPNYAKAMMGGLKEGAKDQNSLVSTVTGPMGAAKAVRDQYRQNSNFQNLVDSSRSADTVASHTGVPSRQYNEAEHPPIKINNGPDDYTDAEWVSGPPTAIKQLPPGRGQPSVMDEQPMTSPYQEPLRNSGQSAAKDTSYQHKPAPSKNLSEKEYALRMLWEDGKNSMKEHYAEKGADQFPGNLDSESYMKNLEMGVDGRNNARKFNRDEAGAELVPHFEKTKQVFKEARNQRFGELQDQAASQYEGSHDILKHIGNALEDAHSTNETKGIAPLLEDIQNKVASGKGTRRQGLQEGNWDEVDGAERFNRLQKAREQLYAKKIYAKKEGLSESEHILQDLTDKIDAELKISPEKVEGDRMYRNAKGLEKSMFNKTDFEGGVDKYKIAGMLKNTDSAKRFRDNVGRFESFVNDPNLNPKLKQEASKLLSTLKGASDTAEQQRALQDFRFRNGPSSPEIARMTAIMGGDRSPLTDAIRAPSEFMASSDSFAKSRAQRYFGKSYGQLADHEKDALVKLKFWETNNENASREQADKYLNKVLKKKTDSGGMNLQGSAKGLPEQIQKAALDYVKGKAIRYGADQAYNAVSGTDKGLPDPLRDEATQYLKDKFNLTDQQAEYARRMMPSIYDLARKGARGVSKVIENDMKKGDGKIGRYRGSSFLDREVEHNGEKLVHEVFKSGDDEISHVLRREHPEGVTEDLAIVKGKMMQQGDKKGLGVTWAASKTKGEGHGKKLYDLALDTHGQIFSDKSLSPDGSHRVYAEHFMNAPGVDTKLAEWGSKNRHDVSLKDQAAFQKANGIKRFPEFFKSELKDVNDVPQKFTKVRPDDWESIRAGETYEQWQRRVGRMPDR